jgi:hypothetical protein
MIARLGMVMAVVTAISGGAGADEFGGPDRPKPEWPDGPNKEFFKNLLRPDNHKYPERDETTRSCCGAGDTVPTRFRVEPGEGRHLEDRWYAWLSEQWVAISPDVIVPDFAPDGRAYLFVIDVPSEVEGRSGIQVIACFVRPRGGL